MRNKWWEITPKNTPKKGPEVGDKPHAEWPTLVTATSTPLQCIYYRGKKRDKHFREVDPL